MKCPVCTTVDLCMSDRQNVEIDYCPQCRGVWLDRGELDKLIERTQSLAPPASSQQQQFAVSREKEEGNRYGFGGTNDRHPENRARKKKSFLGEFFDFD